MKDSNVRIKEHGGTKKKKTKTNKPNISSTFPFQDLKLLSCKHMVVLWTMSETMEKKYYEGHIRYTNQPR